MEPRKADTVVVDLDGTLANIDHRRHLVEGPHKDWKQFYALCWADKVNEWCSTMIESLLQDGLNVAIVSARSKEVDQLTRQWILNNVWSDSTRLSIHMVREEGDYTPDYELKKKWLHAYGIDRILFAVDDRARIVKMWREYCIPTLQCDDWEEEQKEKLLRDALDVLGNRTVLPLTKTEAEELQLRCTRAAILIVRFLGPGAFKHGDTYPAN